MGINFNSVGDDYVAYGKRGPVFEGQENEQTEVPVGQNPTPPQQTQKTDEQILQESEMQV